MSPQITMPTTSRTVVVLGVAYGGARAAKMLAEGLPHGWRVVAIDRNSHMNHVYVFPRFTVVPKHAPKGFIPFKNIFGGVAKAKVEVPTGAESVALPTPPLTPTTTGSQILLQDHVFIQANVIGLTSKSVTFVRPDAESGSFDDSANARAPETIAFDYCIYALGSGMPDPVNVWGEHPNMPAEIVHDDKHPPVRGLGTKKGGVRWMQCKNEQLRQAKRIVIVGGGALGIEFATDLKDVYPDKEVTLLHSRDRLMPIYPAEMHDAMLDGMTKLGVNVILGERVVTWPDEPESLDGKTKIVGTDKGSKFEADLVLPCTGQRPHVALMASLSVDTIDKSTGRIRVLPTMQVSSEAPSSTNTADQLARLSLATPPDSTASSAKDSNDGEVGDLTNMFAVGDCAEAGTIQAGHTAYWQGEVAARNIIRLAKRSEGICDENDNELEEYKSGPPAIKVTLGLKNYAIANGDGVTLNDDGVEDMHARVMWPVFHADDLGDDE